MNHVWILIANGEMSTREVQSGMELAGLSLCADCLFALSRCFLF